MNIRFPTLLDRYIIRQFFGGFLFSITLIVSIAITIDLGEHIKNYVQHDLSIGQVLGGYYLYFIPYIVTFIGPYFVFITVIYFTSRLANKSEIIAMFNSGMSFKRFLVPYIFTSILLAIGLWYISNYLVPQTDKKRLIFENKYIAYQPQSSDMHIHRRLNDSQYFYFRVYDNLQKAAYNVSFEEFKNGKLITKILAEKGDYDTLKKEWTFVNYFKRSLDPLSNKETMVKGEKLPTNIILDPIILIKRWTHIQELNRDELMEKVKDLKAQGSEAFKQYEMEYYRRTAKSFGLIILTIIGVVLASKKVRGGLGLHLMLGLTLGSIYEVVVKFSDSFALKANLDSMLATWIPNLLFIIIAIFLWKKIQE